MNGRIDVIDELRRANPVPNEQSGEFAYPCAARLREARRDTREATVTRIGDAPSSRGATWRGWPLARAAAAAAVLAGGLVIITGDDERPARVDVATASIPETPPPPPYVFDLETGERTALNLVVGDGEFQPSPDGTRMLFYQDGALSISDADGSGVVAVDVHGDPEWVRARWSPDGTRVVYQERSTTGRDVGNLFVHEVATGRRTQVTDLDLEFADWFWLWPSFSPDGQNVVFHLARDGGAEPGFGVWSVPVTGGDPELLAEDAAWPRYLPDGRLVYVASPRTMHDGEALVIAAADGSTRTLAEGIDGIRRVDVSPGGTRVIYVAGGESFDDGSDDHVYVVTVETGEVAMLDVEGEWVDDHTLLVGP
jgi:hypothetical protein